MLIIITLVHSTKCQLLRYYPVIANFSFFSLFFITSFMKEPIVQKLAKLIDAGLDENACNYLRRLNYVWAGFTFCNFLVSLYTVFLSEKVWAVYNGCVSYLLVGTVFVIEYFVRQNYKRKHGG